MRQCSKEYYILHPGLVLILCFFTLLFTLRSNLKQKYFLKTYVGEDITVLPLDEKCRIFCMLFGLIFIVLHALVQFLMDIKDSHLALSLVYPSIATQSSIKSHYRKVILLWVERIDLFYTMLYG